jgi:hypothetical protein
MPSPKIRSQAMRVFPVKGNCVEVHAKIFFRRRVIHRSCGEQLLRALLASMNNSGIAISPAFQRWVGRQKITSPEGTAEVQFHTPSFSRPFGTCAPCGMFPGVKTPGYSQDVPPACAEPSAGRSGQRNMAAAFSAEQATRFISEALNGISRLRCPARKTRIDLPGERAGVKWRINNPHRLRPASTRLQNSASSSGWT